VAKASAAKSKVAAVSAAPETPIPAGKSYVDETVPLAMLIPDERNAKIHTKKQIALVADWMLAVGVTNRPLIDENNKIIAGHGRRLSLLQLVEKGHKEFAQVPVRRAIGWTEEEKRLYRIADNQTNAMTGVDMEAMEIEIQELNIENVDLQLTGFSDSVIKKMLGEVDLTPEAKVFGGDRFLVHVECETEAEQQALFEELQERGMAVKVI